MTAQNFDELRNIVNRDMPTFVAASYGEALPAADAWANIIHRNPIPAEPVVRQANLGRLEKAILKARPQPETETQAMTTERRLVRVLVVDPDELVPNADALLFDSKEMFTDKTDQELFFGIGIDKFLEQHNGKRTKIVNKTIKDRTEHLEPARIRDLKMLVLTLAKF
jgi:hypothetical protein